MKNFILLLLFVPFISCSDGYTIANAELTTGCFKSNDDIVKISENTLQFNDGVVMEIKRSNDSYSYFINGYFNGTELLATEIEYNPQSKSYRWTRFESGLSTQYFTKVDCQ
ncbi:hypothetical protein OAM97_02335 [Flavobacteriaceae bacterium]|nr:hypothetical protein [Flavobacteriaceae bacterium]